MPSHPHRFRTRKFRLSAATALIAVSFMVGAMPAASASAAVRPVRAHAVHKVVPPCRPSCRLCLPPIC